MLAIDHVVLGVRDFDASAARLLGEHGLASVPGGRHAAWGTGNRIVPLGETYLELLAVVDDEVAATSDVGRFLRAFTADGDRWFALCLSDDDLDGTAARLGVRVVAGERERPDGTAIRWRSCGFEDDPEQASRLPFFIEWDVPPAAHPGRTPAEHRVPAVGIAWIEMGDDAQLADRTGLDGRALPIRIVEGEPGVRRVALATAGGNEIVL